MVEQFLQRVGQGCRADPAAVADLGFLRVPDGGWRGPGALIEEPFPGQRPAVLHQRPAWHALAGADLRALLRRG
ncbi:hypothetical protein D3C76_1748430 [compost metagenome]